MNPITTAVVIALAVLLLGWAVWTFNLLVRRRNGVAEAWATIGVELTRRRDLVPSLVQVVRGYAEFEETLFARIAETRSRAITGGADAAAETALTDALRSLFAVAEAYPELRASEQFRGLQEELSVTEDRIAYARSLYNAWVMEYETARQVFPSSLLAALLGFQRRPFFEADVGSRGPVDVSLRDAAGQR